MGLTTVAVKVCGLRNGALVSVEAVEGGGLIEKDPVAPTHDSGRVVKRLPRESEPCNKILVVGAVEGVPEQ
jgi:hypothetical protein